MALRVQARDNDDGVLLQAVEKRVRKPRTNEGSSSVSVEHRKGFWMLDNKTHRCPQRSEELRAEPLPLPFVPGVCVFDVDRGGRSNDDRFHRVRPSISLSTQSQGIPLVSP